MFNWKDGRQGTGYKVMTFIEKGFKIFNLLGFDCHLIKYEQGHKIPPHRDKVESGRHYRLNLVLRQPFGGRFRCQKCILLVGWRGYPRLVIFRPDKYKHTVTTCQGIRLVLSIGWVLK